MDTNLMELNGKNIIVTGCSRGIGKETAIFLSKLGANIILISRQQDKLKAVKEVLEGTNHLIFPLDLNNVDKIEGAVKDITNRVGPLYGLVHCAGMQKTIPFRNTKMSDYLEVFNINFFAFVALVKSFSKKGNHEKNGGSIVAISSVAAVASNPGLSAYASSKSALISLVKTTAIELASKNIRVNCISPAWVRTEMYNEFSRFLSEQQTEAILNKQPLGLGEHIDIAHAVAFLMAQTGRWITGSNLFVDGGYMAYR